MTEQTATVDPMRTMIVASITSLTDEANVVASRISAATTDKTKLVHDILTDEETTDEKIKAFQSWKEALLAKLEEEEAKAREHAATLLPTGEETDVDKDKATYKELADKVKTARKFYLTTLPGATEDDLKDVPALKTLRGGTASSGGGKRPRVQRISYRASTTENWTEVSKQAKNAKGEDVTVTNFTVLAQELHKVYKAKVEVKDLQAAAFDAAGTDDLNSLDGKVFEFATSVGDKTVFVQVQPKADTDE
jgi:hypothetical protein